MMSALLKVIFEMFAVMLFILLVIYSVSIDQDFNQLIPTLSILVLSIYRIAPSVTRILQNFQRLKHYMPSFYILKSAFENNKKEIKIESENTNLDFKFSNIELKNINFYYKKNEYVLENINFKIEKNQEY